MSLLRQRRFKAGDLVELRSPAEILATLDDDGRMDGLQFMPEMLDFFGRTFRVAARLERACDTISGFAVRRIPDAVVLEETRCSGSFHGGCQAGCRIYWKEAWLRPAGEVASDLGLATSDYDALATRISRVTQAGDGPKPIFRCQATALLEASEHVRRRDAPRSYAMEVISKNVGVGHFIRVVSRMTFEGVAKRLKLMPHGLFMPYDESKRDRSSTEPPRLEPGQLVRIRSREEIARTLGRDGRHKGLWFDREMAVYCGRSARVLRKVDRIIDEHNGKMIELKNDCYILDGIVCKSDLSNGRRFCPRAIYPYWRAVWLEPIMELAPMSSTSSETPKSPVAA
jgi:hypothetical protein